MRVCLNLTQKLLENPIQISEHVMIPKSHHAITSAHERSGPRFVNFGRVLSAIDLNDKSMLDAAKVDHKRSDGPLPLELQPCEPAIAQL